MRRRRELEKEMEKNERERLQTSIEAPQDDLESCPSVSQSLDLSFDDSSAMSMTSSIPSSFRDTEDDLAKQKLLAQFSPGNLCFTLPGVLFMDKYLKSNNFKSNDIMFSFIVV